MPGLCPICRRECRGLQFNPKPTGMSGGVIRACSPRHLELAKSMIDPTEHEQEAMVHAGEMGGEYLDHLGKTDLAGMSEEEWRTFVEAICTGYVEKLSEIADRLDHAAGQLRRKVMGSDIPF